MFKGLGVAVLIYTLYAISVGEVFAKSGIWGKTILRIDSTSYFWVVITIYALLGIALLTVF